MWGVKADVTAVISYSVKVQKHCKVGVQSQDDEIPVVKQLPVYVHV